MTAEEKKKLLGEMDAAINAVDSMMYILLGCGMGYVMPRVL